MVRQALFAGIAFACVQSSLPATAQVAPAQPTLTTSVQPCQDCVVVPALTPVKIELMATLGSKISTSGESFPIKLAQPIMIGGKVAVPAGTVGMGEVVHAKKSGGSGAAGELVLAARYLDVNGQRLRLRSMNFAQNGHSNTGAVNAVAVASAASPLPIGLIGFLITGGQTTVPQGTIADAKTAEAFMIPPSPPTQKPDQQSGGETK